MKNKKIVTNSVIVIAIILVITTGFFVWKYTNGKSWFQLSSPNTQQEIIENKISVISDGHKHVDLGDGNGTIKDDECLTKDFKYVTYGLKRVIYTVKINDNLWNVLSFNLDQQELVRKLKSAELLKVLDSIKDRIKAMSSEDLKKIGINSGRVNMLEPGDRINLSPLILDVASVYDKTGVNLLRSQTSSQYRKNDKYVCWANVLLIGSDPETFIAFDNGRAMDKGSVYSSYTKLPDSDPNLLIFLDKGYSLDAKSVYFSGSKIEGADVDSFQVLGGGYAMDKNNLYAFNTKIIEGVDPTKISFIGSHLKYGDTVYYGKIIMRDVNASKFTQIGDGFYSKDDKYVYSGSTIIQNADPQTFQALSAMYVKDAFNVFCQNRILEGADPSTFITPSPIKNVYDAEDKNNTYHSCKPTSKKK